jgi:hypothetical protein
MMMMVLVPESSISMTRALETYDMMMMKKVMIGMIMAVKMQHLRNMCIGDIRHDRDGGGHAVDDHDGNGGGGGGDGAAAA